MDGRRSDGLRWGFAVTNKRKQRVRQLMAETGMSYQAALQSTVATRKDATARELKAVERALKVVEVARGEGAK